MPALKPNKDLDILVVRGVTGENYKKVLELNKKLIKGPLNFGVNAAGQRSIIASNELKDLYKDLKASANNNAFDTQRNVFPINLNDFYRTVTTPAISIYNDATKELNLQITPFLSSNQIATINKGLLSLNKHFKDIYLIEQIRNENKIDKVLYGYLTANDKLLSEEEDPYSISERISNLKLSNLFFDSLYASLNELQVLDSAAYTPISQNIRRVVETIKYNTEYLQKRLKELNTILEEKAQESLWLIGNTQSKDLQTIGASIFTLDVGIANIWARNIDNKIAYIPKLFYGVNIYFRSVDKNIKRKYLPRRNEKNSKEDYDILSKRTIFQHLCLTLGFTIGSVDKTNFDNFFAGSSLLIGPSYRISRSFRLSTGICFLKRSDINPLKSEKRVTSGYYLSGSLDFDILGTLSKVTGLLIK